MSSDRNAASAATELMQSLMHFPAPLALLDRDGRVQITNRKFSARFGPAGLDAASLHAAARGATVEGALTQLPPALAAGTALQLWALHTRQGVLLMAEDLQDASPQEEFARLRRHIGELEQLATTDHLTSAWNRAHLDRVIQAELARSRATRLPLSLVLIDIDHFKRINDSHGHAAGDAALRQLVERVRSRMRSADLLFRWGGEEFVVLVSSAGYRSAETVAEGLRRAVAERPFDGVGKLTISLGVAEHAGEESAAEWFERLDAALYAAKDQGRDRVVVDRRGNSDTWAAQAGGAALHLAWQEGYECGNATIDAEHRELFVLANVLIDAAVRDASDPAAVHAALDALLAHVARHFADEEQILERLQYEQLEPHRRAHAGLLRRARELKSRLERDEAGLGDIVEFLAQDVVARHMIAVDSAFFPLFAGP